MPEFRPERALTPNSTGTFLYMAAGSLKLAFVMDPVESEDFGASTTIILMLEAQRRGHEVLYVDPGDLCIAAGRAAAWGTPVRLDWQSARVERGESRFLVLDLQIITAHQDNFAARLKQGFDGSVLLTRVLASHRLFIERNLNLAATSPCFNE